MSGLSIAQMISYVGLSMIYSVHNVEVGQTTLNTYVYLSRVQIMTQKT